MSSLTPEQRKVLGRIKRIGRSVGATPKEIKAAIETGLVESNLSNPSGGDADSAGWRQERASIYKDPTNLDASIRRFFSETAAVKDQHATAGSLAAAVQRPAAQFRSRYQQRAGEASTLLGGAGDSSGASGSMRASAASAGASTRTLTTKTPGVDNRVARASLIQSFLDDSDSDPVEFAAQANALKDIAPTSTTKTVRIPGATATPSGGGGSSGAASGSGLVAQLKQRADTIDRKRLPYQWGGGHGGKVDPAAATPLDCSGAVSAVLGINPRVASQFEGWGSPGDGGSRGVTIYAKDTHVLMKINGHFFGTSGTNPGGGAGWIPQQAISPQYLQGFTVRHTAAA